MSAGKDATFTMRIDAELRAAFVAACDRNDTPASQVIRHFMRDYVNANAQSALPLKGSKK